MTFATKITLLRIILIPFFVLCFYLQQIELGIASHVWYSVACLLFIFLSITDWLDGYIARAYNQVSTLGKFLDPLADKVLVSAAMIMLLTVNLFPAWAIIVMLVREFVVAGIRMMAASEGVVMAADIAGKIKTILQMIALICALVALAFFNINQEIQLFLDIQYILLTLVTVYSGWNYVHQYLKAKKE